MAFSTEGRKIKMVEGDFGLKLPFTITGTTLSSNDELKLVIKDCINGTEIIAKTYTDIADNTVQFELTESESALLPVGEYVWRLDWFQNGIFMCNVVPFAPFRVVVKA